MKTFLYWLAVLTNVGVLMAAFKDLIQLPGPLVAVLIIVTTGLLFIDTSKF